VFCDFATNWGLKLLKGAQVYLERCWYIAWFVPADLQIKKVCNTEHAPVSIKVDALRFRPNLVLWGSLPYDDDNWQTVSIYNQQFIACPQNPHLFTRSPCHQNVSTPLEALKSTSGCPWPSDTVKSPGSPSMSWKKFQVLDHVKPPVWNPGPKIVIPHFENHVLKVFRFRSWKPRVWKSRPQSWNLKSWKPCLSRHPRPKFFFLVFP